jgi:hypothetical protein
MPTASVVFIIAYRHSQVDPVFKYLATKEQYKATGGWAPHSIKFILDEAEWSASCSGRFTPRKRLHEPLNSKWVSRSVV